MNTIDFLKTDCTDLACHINATFLMDMIVMQECSSLPDNLLGYTASMVVYDDDATVITVTGVIATPSSGIIHFEISATETGELSAGLYKHYINLTTGSTVYRVAEGYFEVTV